MRIIGIDPGLSATGWAVIDGLKLKSWGVIKPKGRNTGDLLLAVHRELKVVLEKEKPDICALEDVFIFKDPISALKLGMAKGVCMMCLADKGIPIKGVNPARVKKLVAGSGSASKESMKKAVSLILKAEITNQHASDATAIALTLLHDPSLRLGRK